MYLYSNKCQINIKYKKKFIKLVVFNKMGSCLSRIIFHIYDDEVLLTFVADATLRDSRKLITV